MVERSMKRKGPRWEEKLKNVVPQKDQQCLTWRGGFKIPTGTWKLLEPMGE